MDENERKNELLDQPVATLTLHCRARSAMRQLGISTIGELLQKTADDILDCKNAGCVTLTEIRHRLADRGLSLRNEPAEVLQVLGIDRQEDDDNRWTRIEAETTSLKCGRLRIEVSDDGNGGVWLDGRKLERVLSVTFEKDWESNSLARAAVRLLVDPLVEPRSEG